MTTLPEPPVFDPNAEDKDKDKGKGKASGSNTLGFGGNAGKVVPAWMKLGKSGSEWSLSLLFLVGCRVGGRAGERVGTDF